MTSPASPSSSTSGSYIIAEEAGIGSNGEIVSGISAKTEARQSSEVNILASTPAAPQDVHQANLRNSSGQHQAALARNDGNIIMREPGDEAEQVQARQVVNAAPGPASKSFEDYGEALDYMDEDLDPGEHGYAQRATGSQVVPPPLSYLQQATGILGRSS